MALARSFVSRRFHSLLLHPQNHLHILHSSTPHSRQTPPFPHRFIASSPQTVDLSDPESERKKNKKPLPDLFKGPVGVPEKTENSQCEGKGKSDPEIKVLQKKLRQLERHVSRWTGKSKQEGDSTGLLKKEGHNKSEGGCQNDPDNKEVKKKLGKLKKSKANSKEDGVPKRLFNLFSVNKRMDVKFKRPVVFFGLKQTVVLKKDKSKKANPITLKKDKSKKANPITLKKDESKKAKPTTLNKEIAPVEMHKEVKQKEPMVLKELSPYMTIVVHHLYKEGYFNFANFAKGERFDLSWFDTEYARKYILFAVQKFGKDKQEISKWLSGSDLKQVAMFGCPSFNRSIVIPSKRLRNFFSIPENTVCSKCVLRESCTFVNQSVWGSDTNKLDLAIVMKVICSYALFVHPELVVPDELKNSVNRLLMEVLKLSKTV